VAWASSTKGHPLSAVGHRLPLVALSVAWIAASAWGQAVQAQALEVELRARVSEDLSTLEGSLRWQGVEGVGFEDYLGALPPPPDDRTALRTWPWGPEQGSLSWREERDERGLFLSFEAVLPDRYGAVGRVPGAGLFLAGGWYPVPVDSEGRVLEARWDAVVEIPDGALGGLGSMVGPGELRWAGRGERVGLAVIPGGRVERLETPAGALVLLSERGLSRGRRRWLQRSLEQAWPEGEALELVVVDAPLLRRLHRCAPGMLFLSSRAFRLSPGLRHLHQGSVGQGLLCAGLADALPGHGERAFVAAVLAERATAETPDAQGLLRWFSWLPQIDELLYSGSVPYVAEVMGEPWPGDPLQDDLLEVLDPRVPGAVVVGRARARGVEVDDLAAAVLAGELGPAWVVNTRYQPYEQDYKIVLDRIGAGAELRVSREAPADAPAEPLVLVVDQQRQTLAFPQGGSAQTLSLDTPPRSVLLDPDGLTRQPDRANDRWPSRWTTVLSAFPTVWNLSSGRLEGYLALRFRRQHDTRWYYDSFLFRDEVDEIGARAALGYAWGPLQDRRWRPYRLYSWASGSLLDADFRPTDRGRYALDAGATLVWDSQVDWLFPLRGHRFTLGGNLGLVPSSPQRWAGVHASASGVTSPHPRIALAGQVRLGRSWGEVEHRLQVLGGVDNLRSLPASLAVGESKIVGRAELRAAPLRHRSVPLGFAWLDELQLSGGLEAGLLGGAIVKPGYGSTPPDAWVRAAGWTGGGFVVLDVLGGQPALAGLIVAGPIASDPGFTLPAAPSIYLLWEQAY
jgi:hypothetical protein